MADELTFFHGGNVYEAKRWYGKEVIDFSANINPLGLPPGLKKAIYKSFDRILHYPDPDARSITQKIAKYWGIERGNILLGNGSVELIYLIMFAYRPEMSLIPVPAFSEYERAARGAGSKIRFLKLEEKGDFKLNLSKQSFADIFFVCNPNNPTGNLILEHCEGIDNLANKLLVVDEAFMDFLPDQKKYTLIWRAVKSRKIVVLRTFTKFFALPGLRMGYIIGHKEVINKLKQHQPPWSANSLAQIAAELILDNKEYVKRTYKFIEEEREFLSRQLAKMEGLRPYPSVTNFLLIKIEIAGMTSKSLTKKLIKKGILIRDCSNFRSLNDKYVRVAVRSHKENLQLLAALKEVL